MLIANPIYDSVFKYLLEDLDIARDFLSLIIKEEIVYLEVKPQESTLEMLDYKLSVFRLDFKATIKTENGEYKKLLIELQKAKKLFDVMRFRRYLGENYRKKDQIINENGKAVEVPLPIITIYFLSFELESVPFPVLKVARLYEDVVRGTTTDILQEEFVALLTHESYMIQIPRLRKTLQSRLEKILTIFDQSYIFERDKQFLTYKLKEEDHLLKKMVNRLLRAASDEELRNQMDFEEELEGVIHQQLREHTENLRIKEQELLVKQQIISEKDQVLAEKDQVLTEKLQELSVKDQELLTKKQEISEKDQVLAEKDQVLAEKNQVLTEKLQELSVKDQELLTRKQEISENLQVLAEKDQVLTEKLQELSVKDQELLTKKQEISEKDQVLAEKDQVLAKKDQVLAEKDQTLLQQQKEIEELKKLLASKK
ncbi:MAG: hypothetical protein EAZ97_09205 [Bacteroidetes bacterium]|nr:MAG: hypothetical protein EAZ97_09205 [Bacteroidota bacterium]